MSQDSTPDGTGKDSAQDSAQGSGLVIRRPEDDDRRASRIRLVEGALAGLALLLLVFSVLVLGRAQDHDKADVERSALRDEVLLTARSEIETLSSLDYRKVDEGLAAWERVTTGQLKDQIVNAAPEQKERLKAAKVITVAKVADAGVVDLDEASATVIAAVVTTARDESGTPGAPTDPDPKRNRYVADLVKVGDRWLLQSLQQVEVNIK